jgi:phage terminase small subunit
MSDPTVISFPQDGRAPPPARLSPAEADTWRAVVGSRSAGHFGAEVFPILEAYCATAAVCDHVGSRLRVEDGVDHALLETYDRMTRSLMSLAEALGLLPGAKRAGSP